MAASSLTFCVQHTRLSTCLNYTTPYDTFEPFLSGSAAACLSRGRSIKFVDTTAGANALTVDLLEC
jgi:hypothetical protein